MLVPMPHKWDKYDEGGKETCQMYSRYTSRYTGTRGRSHRNFETEIK